MSPERPSQEDQLNEGEWQLLAKRLPVITEFAETGFYRHAHGVAEVLVLPIESDTAPCHYYVYHAETKEALTIYDIEPTTRQLRVYDKRQLGYLQDFETADTNFKFDEIIGVTTPNIQNLAGLRGFLRELQNEEDLFAQLTRDDSE